MFKPKAKSLFALLLAGTMLFATACGSDGKGSSTGGDSTGGDSAAVAGSETSNNGGGGSGIDMSNVNELGTVPILKEKKTLSVLIGTDTNIEDFKTNDYTKKLEEGANVDLDFQFLPAGDEGKQKLSVTISSGGELPDLIIRNLTPIETYVYGAQGVFLPLNDYIDSSYYTKNYLDTEDGQGIMKYINSPDGNIYGWPRICQDLGNDWDHRLWINKTWLDAVGMAIPTTTDEYYEALKAFKEKDPNGNGKNDEIPLVGNIDGWNHSVWKPLLNAFTYVNDTFNYMQVAEDGSLQFSYMQPEFREGLEWLNKLSNEGLLSPLTFTQKQDQFKQMLENEEAQIIGSITAGSMSVYQVESKRKEDMTHMAPLVGPEGVQYTQYRESGIPDFFAFITKDCKDPVAAAMVLDYMWNRDMSLQARFGIKDEDWKTPEEGEKSMYADLGYDALVEYINPIWGTLQNHHWGENHPSLCTYDFICGQTWNGNPNDSQYMTAQAVPEYVGKIPDKIVTRLIYTQEEADQIAEIQSTIETSYLPEAVASFVTGTRPLSDWDNYISELKNIGTDTYLQVATQAYRRMQEAK